MDSRRGHRPLAWNEEVSALMERYLSSDPAFGSRKYSPVLARSKDLAAVQNFEHYSQKLSDDLSLVLLQHLTKHFVAALFPIYEE